MYFIKMYIIFNLEKLLMLIVLFNIYILEFWLHKTIYKNNVYIYIKIYNAFI